MRPRDLNRLPSTTCDVAVIGGGIYGLFCAYEAASRGLRVALLDAGDLGAGASFNHQKTAHGGLRSLQSLSLGRARESIRERRALARIAPLLLRPLPFLVGTYRSVTRNRLALRAAFALDGWIGRDRNEGLEPELHLPRARLLSPTATQKLFPGIRPHRLTGGAQWYDYQIAENDRLTWSVAAAADRAGADLATYAEVEAVHRAEGRPALLRVRDRLSGDALELTAHTLVNAAGARVESVMSLLGVRRSVPLLRAMNLVTARAAADIALAAPDTRGRMLTLVPWRGHAIVGTWQSAVVAKDGEAGLRGQDVDEFIADANAAFPALRLTRHEVRLVHAALVPARAGTGGDLLPATEVVDHARDGVPDAISILGAKFTTARAAGERVVDLIGKKLRRPLRPSRTARTVLPGAGIADHEALAIETARRHGHEPDPALVRHLTRRYGELAAEIVRLALENPALAAPLAPDQQAIGAEVVYAIRHEMALHLTDIVLRRTTIGAAGHPGAAALSASAALAAGELGWDQSRVRDEIAAVEAVYRLP